MTILDFFISRWKKLATIEKLFGSWGHALVAVAVVERLKQESVQCMNCRSNARRRDKKTSRCKEVAASGGSTVKGHKI